MDFVSHAKNHYREGEKIRRVRREKSERLRSKERKGERKRERD
jgi:hypothetical protein